MTRYFYASGRTAAARLRTEGARSIHAADPSQFPPGVHSVRVESASRDGSFRASGPGARSLTIQPATRGDAAPPVGARVQVEITWMGDVELLVESATGICLVTRHDGTGELLAEYPSVREAREWIRANKLREIRPVGRLLPPRY